MNLCYPNLQPQKIKIKTNQKNKEIEKEIIKKEKAEQIKAKANEKANEKAKANEKEKENKKLKEKLQVNENTKVKIGENIINNTPINNCEFPYIDDIVNKKDLEGIGNSW